MCLCVIHETGILWFCLSVRAESLAVVSYLPFVFQSWYSKLLRTICFIIADSDVESWDGTESMGIEECLFCSHVSSSLETNLEHMTVKHSFFLPDAEYISDLEGLIVYLGNHYSSRNWFLLVVTSSENSHCYYFYL